MSSINTIFDNYPKWYCVEKNTEKIIKKLTTIKELDAYLKNPDEFIRRIAILRINELRLKDSIMHLKELLDDPLENQKNKDLAAWTIKVLCQHWNIDMFITNKYLNKYSGKENYEDIYKITISDNLPSLKFNFASSLLSSELQLENNSIRNSDDVDLKLPFSVKEWFSQYSNDIIVDLKKIILKTPSFLAKIIKKSFLMTYVLVKKLIIQIIKIILKIYLLLSKKRDKNDKTTLNTTSINYIDKSHTDEISSLRKSYSHTPIDNLSHKTNSISMCLKKFMFNLLYILFAPFRLVVKHKKLIIVVFIFFYLFLSFTMPGKILTYRYTGLDLAEEQAKAYSIVKEVLVYALDEIHEFLGGKETLAATSDEDEVEIEDYLVLPAKETKIHYRVFATSLNLREEANSSSLIITSLPQNSIVEYIDGSENSWLFVRTSNGQEGWLYSQYVEEIGGALYE
ncbi:UNVERIFIED_CONTAM: SH3 domain-containing protein [Acetivibrio alkalicellulosi]